MELLQQGMPGICAEAVSWEKVATASDVDGNSLDQDSERVPSLSLLSFLHLVLRSY